MSALDAFLSTWQNARITFGEGTPQGGDSIDQSAQLRAVQSEVEGAAPRDWTGSAAETYADANRRQGQALGAMADIDHRLKAEVDRSAEVVAAGRRDLDAVRQWVVDAAATVPQTAFGDQMLYPVISEGAGEVAEIVARSNSELNAIAERIQKLGGEYDALAPAESDAEAEPAGFMGDEKDEEKSEVPETTLDLADIVYKEPGELGDPGMMELVPGSGVWVPDPSSPTYQPKPPQAPLDLNDIVYLGPGVKGQPWQMELIPGSGAWVPDPNHPGHTPDVPEAPVDLSEVELVDPNALVPAGMLELWPHSGILIPDPHQGQPY
jgi:uncharacterized protein YukE